MEEDNVVSVKFRESSNLETYLDYVKENNPSAMFALEVDAEGVLYFNFFGIEDTDAWIGKLERAKDFIKAVAYGYEEE